MDIHKKLYEERNAVIAAQYAGWSIISTTICEMGCFSLLHKNDEWNIIGIVPVKTKSIYSIGETFEVRNFTDNLQHFTHNHFEKFIPLKVVVNIYFPHRSHDKSYMLRQLIPYDKFNTLLEKLKSTKNIPKTPYITLREKILSIENGWSGGYFVNTHYYEFKNNKDILYPYIDFICKGFEKGKFCYERLFYIKERILHKKYFKDHIFEDLMKTIFHPRNIDRFAGLGFD